MKHASERENRPHHTVDVGRGDRSDVRTADNPIGIDDIGLPADRSSPDARRPAQMRPDPTVTQAGQGTAVHGGKQIPEGQKMNTDQDRRAPDPQRDEEDQKTSLEKVASKIVPPSHEVSDEDIMNPGKMTPGSPPVDNRS